MTQDGRPPVLHLLGAVGRGEWDGGQGHHGDVVLIVPHAVEVFPGNVEHLQQPGHHPPLVAPPVGDLQVEAVGKDGLIPAGTVLLQPLPGPE